MSLVNDLLIELDRNRTGTSRSDANPLKGLSPRKPPALGTKAPIGRGTKALALVAAGLVGFGIAQFDSPATPNKELASTVPLSSAEESIEIDAVGESKVSALPRVSAPRPSASFGESEPRHADLRINRPAALRALRVQQTGVATRVEIATDSDAEYRIERGTSKGVFNIILEDATLREPLPMLDLFGTAIRSIETQHEGNSVRLTLTLDADSRMQSQRLDQTDSALLIVDFQPSSQPRERIAQQAKPQARKMPKNSSKENRAATAQRNSAKAKKSKPSAPAMQISRSAGDRKRSDRDDARLSAEQTVDSAREAKENGDLERAADLYRTARETSPGHREAIVEGATVLSELGRIDEALLLVGEARNAQPKNPVYLMVHAKLLAEADLQSAITLLDASGLSIEAAPEVQILTAAYLQKNGQHDSAIERYEAILRRFPNRPEVWLGLGISLEARGRSAEAADVYGIAMQVGELPGQSRGWVSARIDALSEES